MKNLLDVGVCIDEIALNLRSLATNGNACGWAGDPVEWECGSLAATTPEPQISLSSQYTQENEIDVDVKYLLQILWALGVEQGYRLCKNETERERELVSKSLIRIAQNATLAREVLDG